MMPRILPLVLLSLLALVARPAQAQGTSDPDQFDVLMIDIKGPVTVSSTYKVQRGLREARSRGASRLLVRIDTEGGALDATAEIQAALSRLADDDIDTVAYVTNKAWSAGAVIAMACRRMYMSSGASIGAITPVQMGAGGTQQIPDTDDRNKAISAVRAMVRNLVKNRGNVKPGGVLVAEAMVDPRLQVYRVNYEDESGFEQTGVMSEDDLRNADQQGRKIVSREQLSRPVSLDATQAEDLGFSAGTYDSLDDLLREELSVTRDEVGQLEPTWSEDAVGWLSMMRPLLFVLGFIMILIEVKTPGVGVPGMLGLILLGFAMFGSYLVGLAEWFEIVLFFMGIGLIAVEVFVIPGTMFAGIAGFLCMFFGLILSQQDFVIPATAVEHQVFTTNVWDMVLMVLLVIVGSIAMWKATPYIPLLNRVLQPPPQTAWATGASTQFGRATAANTDAASIVGGVGEAATDLRPAGILDLDGERWDVVSSGGFITRGTRVRVVEVVGNRITVEPDAGDQEAAP